MVDLRIAGVSCGKCVGKIEQAVSELDGVDSVKMDLDSRTLSVEFDERSITIEEIATEIEEIGYDVLG